MNGVEGGEEGNALICFFKGQQNEKTLLTREYEL